MSCEKAVEVEPVSVITSPSFWKTQNDAVGAINGLYVQFRKVTDQELFLLGEARSEVLASALAGTVGLDKYYNQSLNVSNAGPSWINIYQTINHANLLLKYVPTISFSDENEKNEILAQAYSMRAFLYFVLSKTWGKVPIRTEPTEGYNPSTIQIPRSEIAEIFTLIKSDLEAALSLYPNSNMPAGRAKWNKQATLALKGDVYLWTAKKLNGGNDDLTAALNALTAVKTNNISLLENYSDVFSYTNKGNNEILFAVRYQILESNNNIHEYMYYNASNLPTNISPEVRNAIGTIGLGNNGNSIMQVSALVRNQFTNDDARKLGTFYEVKSPAGEFFSAITSKGKGFVEAGTRHFKDDVIIYRYAEVLLMIAEAKNALGQNPAVEINEVRKRAYGVNYNYHIFINGSQSTNDDAILKERLFELTFEGKRRWDLLRFNKAFDLVPALQGKQSQTHLLLFPIGSALRSLEPLVDENPGWD